MFITNEPAMFIDVLKRCTNSKTAKAVSYDRYLLIGDIHLGMTADLRRKGITVRSQVGGFVSRIAGLKRKAKAKNLIMIGDVKHRPQGISWQEEKEIPFFLKELSRLFKKIIIVKGNHDGNIEKLVKGLKRVSVKKGVSMGEYFITHGHRKINMANSKDLQSKSSYNKTKTIIMAHNQPGVRFRDSNGAAYVLPCWVRGNIGKKEVIIMPAFNPLSGHTIVNSKNSKEFSHDKDRLLGPVAKKIKDARAYLLDGTDLGDIKNLKK